VILLSNKVLRDVQNLSPDEECDKGYREIIRFATSFVCKSTKKHTNSINVKMTNSAGD